jgi:hypothetical protein
VSAHDTNSHARDYAAVASGVAAEVAVAAVLELDRAIGDTDAVVAVTVDHAIPEPVRTPWCQKLPRIPQPICEDVRRPVCSILQSTTK